jgi:hypothetical protein
MNDFDDLLDELKQKRDELRLKIHLGSKEAQDEFFVPRRARQDRRGSG